MGDRFQPAIECQSPARIVERSSVDRRFIREFIGIFNSSYILKFNYFYVYVALEVLRYIATKIDRLRALAILYPHTKFEGNQLRIAPCRALTRKSLRTRTRTHDDRKSIVSRELRSGDTITHIYHIKMGLINAGSLYMSI